jgi:hypothetical protein
MRPIRTLVTVVFIAAIAITGCSAHTDANQPSPPPPVPDTTHAPPPPTHPHRPDPAPVDRRVVDRQAPIYAAVLRQYLTSGDAAIAAEYRFSHIFVIDHAVAGAGASGPGASGPGTFEDGPIPPAARRAITHALTDVGPLTFVASGDEAIEPHSCAQVRDHGILITLGPVDGTGDRVQVGVNGHMGCLGANSLTYEVQQTSSGWMVSGTTAVGPVA